jgi:antigen flippase
MQKTPNQVFGGIFKSTALLSSFRVITLTISFIRDKTLAIIIGPQGMAIWASFDIIVSTTVSAFSLGINSSSVRQIALAYASGERKRLAHAISTLRLLTTILGVLGSSTLFLFSANIAHSTFGDSAYANQIRWCSAAVLFTSLNCSFRAQLQGMQKLRGLAWSGAWAAIVGALTMILATYFGGILLVAPALAVSALSETSILIFFTWKYGADSWVVPWAILRDEVPKLVKLGLSLVSALFLSSGVVYITRALINTELGLEQAGFYIAAFALSGKAIGLLIDSMRVDLFPKLSASANDNAQINQLINGQIEFCLLLATPLVIFTISLAPFILKIFYSSEFISAAPILAILSLGTSIKMISSPLAYVRLAKGESLLYFVTEAVAAFVQLLLTYILLAALGLVGVALASVLAGALQACLFMYTSRTLTGHRFHSNLRKLMLFSLTAIIVSLIASIFISAQITAIFGSTFAIVMGLFNFRALVHRLGAGHKLTLILNKIPGSTVFTTK